MSISNPAELLILDATLRNTSYAAGGTIYASLHTADPGETGTAEVTGGTYARGTTTFAAAAAGAASMQGTVSFTNMPAGTVTGVGLWNHATAGTFLWGGTITSKVTNLGDTFQITSLTVSLD